MDNNFLNSVTKLFEYYKMLGNKAFEQVDEKDLFWQPTENSNSIAIIVQHLNGNMLSRFTNFLTTDGEKEWRKRDEEFEVGINNKEELLQKWNEGWNCLFTTLQQLNNDNLTQIVYIRNEGHTVTDAINRQLAHYAYHIGQIVFIAKMATNDNWISLSIPKGKSNNYNNEKFATAKTVQHFTSEFLNNK